MKDDVSGQQCLKMYEQYQKEFNLSKSRRFFERHKDEEWYEILLIFKLILFFCRMCSEISVKCVVCELCVDVVCALCVRCV